MSPTRKLAQRHRRNPAERQAIEAKITAANEWHLFRWSSDGLLMVRTTDAEREACLGASVYGRPRILAGTPGNRIKIDPQAEITRMSTIRARNAERRLLTEEAA